MAPKPVFRYRILVVDDDEAIRKTAKLLLEVRGYEVDTATDGFEGLIHLQAARPDIIISDLRMPNMSGFEFLSVIRRRFPEIGVVAISGEFEPMSVPDSLLADAYLPKGKYSPEELFEKIVELLEQAPLRPRVKPTEKAAVWIPREKTEYVVVTCPYCLRTFATPQPKTDATQQVHCQHCPQNVTFRMIPQE